VSTAEPPAEEAEKTRRRDAVKRFAGSLARRARSRLGHGLWVVAVVGSVLLVAGLAYFVWWPDRQTDEADKRSAITAASEGTAAVYTYASNTVDRDIAAAKSHLTGDFLAQYEHEASTAVAAVARQKPMKTSGAVVGAAVSRLSPDSADVLIFLNQTTTAVGDPGPSMSAGSLMVSLSKVDGKWLISAMKPV
jgi:Mce-associated membrane protein